MTVSLEKETLTATEERRDTLVDVDLPSVVPAVDTGNIPPQPPTAPQVAPVPDGEGALGRMDTAMAAWSSQREVVAARAKRWLKAEDLSDTDLVEEIKRKRTQAAQSREAALRTDITRKRRKITSLQREAAREGRAQTGLHASGGRVSTEPTEIEQLRREIAEIEVQMQEVQNTAEDRVLGEPSGRQVTAARLGKRTQRIAMLVAGCYASVYVSVAEPALGLLAIPATALAWWRWSRPLEADVEDQQAQPTGSVATQQPRTPAQMAAAAAAATGATEPAERPAVGAPAAEVPATTSGAPATDPEADTVVLVGPAATARTALKNAAADPLQVRGAEDLINALVKAKIIEPAEKEDTFVVGAIRPDGPGWTATIELSGGKTAKEAITKADKLASALRVQGSQLQMAADVSTDGHEGRFTIWVANSVNPFAGGKNPSQLITADRWDFWQDGVPLGLDAREARRLLALLWSSWLIGGLQDYGKSYLARLAAAAAALDPYVRLIIITGKPGPDWAACKKVAHRYIAGSGVEQLEQIHEVLDELIADKQAAGQKLEDLFENDPARCPEGKLTRELTSEPGMEMTLLIVDELQEILDAAANTRVVIGADEDEEGGRKRSGKTVLVEKFARFVRVARYVAGMGVFITQRPDAKSVPAELRDVCVKRASMRVKTADSARMVLGEDVVAAGAAPHLLLEEHKGVAVFDVGVVGGHFTVKSDTIDLPDLARICDRGRQLRIDAGTLTGYAAARAGAAAARETEAHRTARDGLAAMDAHGLDRARVETLATLLTETHPDRYTGLTETKLGELLRAAGTGPTVKIGAVDGRTNANGYRREHLATALKSGGATSPA